MSLRDEIVLDGSAAWFDEEDLARAAVYKAGGAGAGDTITVLAVFGANPAVERTPISPGRGSRHLSEEARFLVRAAEVAAPAVNDTITLEDVVWTVREDRKSVV